MGTPAHQSQTEIPCQTPYQIDFLPPSSRTGTCTADQGHSPILADIAVTVAMIHTDAIPGHIIETIDVTIGVLHNVHHSSTYCIPAMIPHSIDHLLTGAHQLTLRTAADHVPIQHTNQVRQVMHKSSSHP